MPSGREPAVDKFKTQLCAQYVFADLQLSQIRSLLEQDEKAAEVVVARDQTSSVQQDYARQDARRPPRARR